MTGPFSLPAHLRSARPLRILTPLAVLTLYFFLYSLVLGRVFPDGQRNVGTVFNDQALPIVALLAVALPVILLVWRKLAGAGASATPPEWKRPHPLDILLVLLPLTPVLQYVLNNQDILTSSGSLYLMGVFGLASLLLVIVIPAALAAIAPTRVMMFLGLAFSFTVTNMAALSASRVWFEFGEFRIQAAVFVGVFVVGWLVHRIVGPKFAVAVVALYFLGNGAQQFMTAAPTEEETPPEPIASTLIEAIGARPPVTTPSIYLLIYDAYVPNETMLGYGLDNSAQEEFLEQSGFTLYPATYSVAAYTVGTMSRVLNASLNYFGKPRTAVSGRGVVPTVLKGIGYQTQGIFWSDYFFQTEGTGYDKSFPTLKATHLLLLKAILMGEFRFDVEFDNPSHEKFAKHKDKAFGRSPRGPRFVYMQDNLPGHSQNSGECRPDETELFAERLRLANIGMKRDIESILANDPEALIVVAGDHGPYLTKNCHDTGDAYPLEEISRLDIQDRVGTFLAIRWPEGEIPPEGAITVLQDIFPVVFAYLFDDPALRDLKIKSKTLRPVTFSGAIVFDGVIQGGIHDGEPLFLNGD